ncbi:MAG: glycine/sarcosine/betaine reductase selenoprotein B family protein [Candidatus Methylomirabilia bacterium]
MAKVVDSYRYLNRASRGIVEAWIAREQPRAIPWTPLRKPLAESRVALVSTAGIALRNDQPFDQEGERKNPWWGDPTFRVIPRTATERDVRIFHLHIETAYALQDLNCIFPLQRLLELEAAGEVGQSAPSHYSFMGYILQPRVLVEESAPAMIRRLRAESVEAVVLVPV